MLFFFNQQLEEAIVYIVNNNLLIHISTYTEKFSTKAKETINIKVESGDICMYIYINIKEQFYGVSMCLRMHISACMHCSGPSPLNLPGRPPLAVSDCWCPHE